MSFPATVVFYIVEYGRAAKLRSVDLFCGIRVVFCFPRLFGRFLVAKMARIQINESR